MTHNRIKGIGLLILFLSATMGQAQNKEKREFYAKNIQPIENDGTIEGYSVFFEDKNDLRSNKEYFLEYYDEAGAFETSTNIVRDGFYRLLESSFNGELLCFKFFNLQTKELVLEFFDVDGEFLYDEIIPSTKAEKYMLVGAAAGNFPWIPTLISVPGKGFVNSRVTREKRVTHFMTKYYSNKGEENDWSIDSREAEEAVAMELPLAAIKDKLFLRTCDNSGLYDIGIRLKKVETGADIGGITFKQDDFTRRIRAVKELSEGRYTVLGYLLNGVQKKETNKGIFKLMLDEFGKQISYSEYLYSKDEQEFDFIHIHDFEFDKSENLIVIGEVLDLKGGSTYTAEYKRGPKVIIGNLLVFKFDTGWNKIDLLTLEKSEKKTSMPFASEYAGNSALAMIVNEAEAFEFVYADNTGATIDIYYYNKEKRKGDKNSYVCVKVTYNGESNTTSTIDLGPDAKRIKVLPGNGKIIVAEYLKKEKKLHFIETPFE